MSKKIIIACEVFKPEIEFLLQKKTDAFDVHYIDHGLHREPDNLRLQLQELIDTLEEEQNPEEIIMAFGFCGRGLYQVYTKKAVLIIPKVHDCIPVLLGTGAETEVRPPEYATTFWLSPGWVTYYRYKHIQRKEELYKQYLADFDEDCANYLMEIEDAWHSSYETACRVDVDGFEPENFLEDSEFVAKDINIPLSSIKGNFSYLEALLDGGNDIDNFFHVKPGQTMDINGDGMLDVV